jgi:hypothetical protein
MLPDVCVCHVRMYVRVMYVCTYVPLVFVIPPAQTTNLRLGAVLLQCLVSELKKLSQPEPVPRTDPSGVLMISSPK